MTRGVAPEVDFDLDARDVRLNPFPYYARMRAAGSVLAVRGRRTYVLSRYDDVARALADPKTFSSNLVGDVVAQIPGAKTPKILILQDPPVHTELRRQLGRAFTPSYLASLATRIEAVSERLASDLTSAKSSSDFAALFGRPLPVIVIGEILGIPLEKQDRLAFWAEEAVKGTIPSPGSGVGLSDVPQIALSLARSLPSLFRFARRVGFRTAREMGRNAGGAGVLGVLAALRRAGLRGRSPTVFNLQSPDFARSQAATLELLGFLDQTVRANRLAPRECVLDTMIDLADRGVLTYGELLSNCAFLLIAGHETTVQLLCQGARVLAERPDVHRQLRASPDLVRRFVDEVLRTNPPLHWVLRRATRDVDVGGVHVPEGSRIVLYLASANRDERRFERPDSFELDRPNAREHLAFGKSHHFCIGAPLARMEAEIAFRVLTQRFERFELDPRQAPEPVDPSYDAAIRGFRSLPLRVVPGTSVAASA